MKNSEPSVIRSNLEVLQLFMFQHNIRSAQQTSANDVGGIFFAIWHNHLKRVIFQRKPFSSGLGRGVSQ